jgi:hypothetical protein
MGNPAQRKRPGETKADEQLEMKNEYKEKQNRQKRLFADNEPDAKKK